jgi:erythronate-4-phosphate dehydrogenase
VIDNQALLSFVESNPTFFTAIVLDVWEGEPLIHQQLLEKVTIATPHIAGYSLEGRTRGTEQVYLALCLFLGVVPKHQLTDFLPKNPSVITLMLTHHCGEC